MNFSLRKIVGSVLVLLAASGANASDFVQGELIVKYKDGVVRSRDSMNALYDSAGVEKVRRYTGVMKGFEQVILKDGIRVEDAMVSILKSDAVEYAQPNFIVRTQPLTKQNLVNMRPMEGVPCFFPGLPFPEGCDPSLPPIIGDPGGGGGGGGCIIPGIPFPPGCDDGGGGGGGGTPPSRPEVSNPPAEVVPPVADPDHSKTYGMDKIGATEAWKSFRGDKKMIVAVIDTGVDYNHEDLSFNMWRNPAPTKNDIVGFNFVHNDGLPFDDNKHGTHTAGTVGATGGNGKGVSGVNQVVSIMALKFLSGAGSGTTADAIRAIDYAVANGAKVLSNSWGGPADGGNQALKDSIERARAKDVLFIAAAGNDGVDNDTSSRKSYPASFDNDNLISVAATDSNDGMASFSNYGKKTTHLAAPGVNVHSTIPGNKYAAFSGTSMACPHVAGAAALVWAKNPTWTYKQVKDRLMQTVDVLPVLNGKTTTGGRLNVLKALSSN